MAGNTNAVRQLADCVKLKFVFSTENIIGIINWVKPDPTLAHPAVTPLASPTVQLENMELIQNWLATKFASEKPTKNRSKMNDNGDEMNAAERIMGAVTSESVAEARRGPKRSHAGPMARREMMEPANAADPAVPTSEGER